VYRNESFLKVFETDDPDGLLVLRPGEAMRCINLASAPGGCGTSPHCRECGVTRTLVKTIAGSTVAQQDCHLLINSGKGLKAKDFRIVVSPWITGKNNYFVTTFIDIEDEKRRRMLERIFFHDILNSAGGASGLIEMLLDEVPEESRATVAAARMSLFAIVEEIQKQKQILTIERNEFIASCITLQGLEVIQTIAAEYLAHPKAAQKYIQIAEDSVNTVVHTDFSLLRRVIVNMLINALEATPAGGTVKLGLKKEGGNAVFWVWNSAVMAETVKLQIFKRSFSTKGEERGLGTYSIRLLTENYLKGKTGFISEETKGTTFWVKLDQDPKKPIQ
jgi:signal transduction histidine kinase